MVIGSEEYTRTSSVDTWDGNSNHLQTDGVR